MPPGRKSGWAQHSGFGLIQQSTGIGRRDGHADQDWLEAERGIRKD
jgi:hypothetical protein